MTKASWLAESADALGDDIERALALAAAGRPGPVHVAINGVAAPTFTARGPSH